MNVLMLNYEFPPIGGGASPVTLELSRHLVKLGHSVDVITMHYSDLPRHEVIDGIDVYRTAALRKAPEICHTHEMATYILGALPALFKLINRKKYDVIHAHFIIPTEPLAFLASKIKNIPFLVTCHGSDVPGYNPDRFGLMHKLLSPAWKFLARQAPLLVSPSQSLKDLILQRCPKARVEVIPNGIYGNMFQEKAKQNRILMCSRILPRKGFQYALEAIKELKTDWQVDVIGEGPYLDELKNIVADSDLAVTFWGWLDKEDKQFKELYETSSIFIFPSEAENFPTVLLEAMSASMAIISSNAGGCPEAVGDAGILVPPRDTQAIKRELVTLLQSQDIRVDLAQKARLRAESFGWDVITKKYIEKYQSLIN